MSEQDAKLLKFLADFSLKSAEIQASQGKILSAHIKKTVELQSLVLQLGLQRDRIFQRREDVAPESIAEFEQAERDVSKLIREDLEVSGPMLAQMRDAIAQAETLHERIGAMLADFRGLE